MTHPQSARARWNHERMLTLGTWLAPIISGIIVAVGIPAGLRWRSRSRRGKAIRRIAERPAYEDSTARRYPNEHSTYLDHYLGGQHWQGQDANEGDPGTRRTERRWRGRQGDGSQQG